MGVIHRHHKWSGGTMLTRDYGRNGIRKEGSGVFYLQCIANHDGRPTWRPKWDKTNKSMLGT